MVFGRLMGYGGLFVVAAFVIQLGNQYLITTAAIREKRYDYMQYRQAWNLLDTTLDKAGRQKMHTAWLKAARNQQ